MLIFEEHFQDNRHQWTVKNAEEYALNLEKNYYTFEHKREGDRSWLSWQSADFFYDRPEFRIHLVLEKVAGSSNHGYGFVWGLGDAQNFFEFVISQSGYYRIAQYEKNCFNNFVAWKYDQTIRQDNAVNILEIRREREAVEFYINSVLVETLSAAEVIPEVNRSFGFIIYDNLTIKVHSLLVSIPHDHKTSTASGDRSGSSTEASFYEHEPPINDTLENIFADLNSLIGHERTKTQLLALANFLQVQQARQQRGLKTTDTCLHLVLSGPPGTGKTLIARLVGRLYKQLGLLKRGQVVETDRAGIVGGYLGQTALRVQDAVDQALDGVLFVDEAYSLIPQDGLGNDYGREAVQVLLKRMEDKRDRLAVIVAGYGEEMEHFIKSNPGLESRFTRWLYLDHYNPEQLLAIFVKFCADNDYTVDDSAYIILRAIFETAHTRRDRSFGNGRLARTIFEQAIEQQANRIVNTLDNMTDEEISLILPEDLGLVEEL